MNFAFKSTFQNINQRIRRFVRTYHHTTWILAANTGGTVVAVTIYFAQITFPATLYARPDGSMLIGILAVLLLIKVLTTLYAVASILIRNRPLLSFIFRELRRRATAATMRLTQPLNEKR